MKTKGIKVFDSGDEIGGQQPHNLNGKSLFKHFLAGYKTFAVKGKIKKQTKKHTKTKTKQKQKQQHINKFGKKKIIKKSKTLFATC